MSKVMPVKKGSEASSADSESLRIKLPVMIPVLSGEFLMGTSGEDIQRLQLKEADWAYDWSDNDLFANEQPQHRTQLETYEIGQFPVTNAEYHCFTYDTGYRLPKSWSGFKFPEGEGLHPVVGVSKIDCETYIRWLNEKTGMNFRLPTEAEWERAARGDDGRIFPWGNMFDPWRCNTSESAKRGTTPVGYYSPGGDSLCGAVDMIGNVFEWTSSQLQSYPYDDEDGREERKSGVRYVIRGGAWYYTRKLARCAAREGMLPEHMSLSVGFRLARTPSPVQE